MFFNKITINNVMTSKKFFTLFSSIFKSSKPVPLGRWHISNSNIQRNLKIDLSNEDHCGTCTGSKYYNDYKT